MGDTAAQKPTLKQRRPEEIAPEEIGGPHQPDVSAAEMEHILHALMEQQTR